MCEYKKNLFIVNRNLYYRHYGPFIELLQAQGHQVYLLHDYNHPKDGVKAGYFPALSSIPQFSKKIEYYGIYYSSSEIIKFIKSYQIDFVFSLHSYTSYEIEIDAIRPCKWIAIQHWADNFQQGKKEVFACDYFLSYSKMWWECFKESDYYQKDDIQTNDPQVYHVGHPLNFLQFNMNELSIKKKYQLHLGKKVLTYLPIGPPKMYGYANIYQYLWLVRHYSSLKKNVFWQLVMPILIKMVPQLRKTEVNEEKIVLAIKQFCKRNNYTFVVKSRIKAPLSKFFYENTDAVLYDETFYPPTISELLYISDIVISHFSMATFEAVAMKCYKININLEPVFDVLTSHYKTLFREDWIKDFNENGMCSIIGCDNFIKDFAMAYDDDYKFENKNYNKFMDKYFSGIEPTRFIEVINEILRKQN